VVLSSKQRTALELIGRARYNGIVITEASTVMKMDTKALFYVLMVRGYRPAVGRGACYREVWDRGVYCCSVHACVCVPWV
jgi:hypothetical protein